jgi:hypothetical protein
LIQQAEAGRELAALAGNPYENDAELAWNAPPGPDLPYDGEIPKAIAELARRRRRQQTIR